MTENKPLNRIRTYDELDKEDDRIKKSGTDTRLRYFYNHGYLGDSKVNYFKSSLENRDMMI